MPVPHGARFGPYEIVGPLGAGGMGEVYRARDTRLDRIVAFKIIASDLANEPQRRERFRREARAISSLSHPHICSLYDVGEQDGAAYLVMEYLDGETLAARLLRGPLPRDEVLQRATEMAAALDHAHRHGVVHRDLKPSNVMLTPTGAKLLDFGLAKLHQTGAGPRPETETIPGAAPTAEGTILGTVQYMAPEQLEGREADVRTDIFAFGTLVYEMATGQRAFGGGSQANVIAAILRADPAPPSAFDSLPPPALDHVIERCLAKDPDERWQTARDLMIELRGILERPTRARRPPPAGGRLLHPTRRRLTWTAAALCATAVGAAAYWWTHQVTTPGADSPATAIRSEIPAPAEVGVGSIALSPDARHLVFVGRSGLISRLWIRPLDSVSAQPLAGTEGADYPFWSPDGDALAFFADGKLKRIDVAGGPVQTLATAPNPRGGTWGRNDTIVFSPGSSTLYAVPAGGGSVEEVTTLDVSRGEISHRWPRFLPDGRHFLYLAQSSVPENLGLFVGSLDEPTKQFLVRTEVSGAYVAPGYLLYLRDLALVAQPFRANSLQTEGDPVPVAEPVGVNGLEQAQFDVSASVLVYRRGAFLGGTEVAWFDRSGNRIGEVGSPADFRAVRISPDGSHVALAIEDKRVGTPDIWVHDVARNLSTRFTFDTATDRDPIWSPDSSRLVVRSNRNGRSNVYARALNRVGGEQHLLESEGNASSHDWSRDGRLIVFTQIGPGGKTDRDIWMLPLFGDRTPYPLVEAPLDQEYPRFSPGGRLISYQTEEAGRQKVYVMPFPDSGDRWEISPDGGVQPVWSGDGKELFYVAPDNTIMAVDVHEGPSTVEFGRPRALFQAPIAVLPARQPNWTWDVSADGQRFLIILSKDEPAPLTLVTNWRADLEK